MKDLTLRKSSDSSLIGTLRCEMFSNSPAANVEVVEIKDATNKRVDQLLVGGNFPQIGRAHV